MTCMVVSSTASGLTGPVGNLRGARHVRGRCVDHVAGRDRVDVDDLAAGAPLQERPDTQASFSNSV